MEELKMNIKGTQTEKNISAALQGESLARNKYTYYALQAKAEGLDKTAEFFERMANNEKEHAKMWFKLLNNGTLGTTDKNLIDSANGESYEWHNMYPSFAKQAREDGLEMIAQMFEKVAAIEEQHDRQFMMELARIKAESHDEIPEVAKSVVEKPIRDVYRCVFCGHIHEKQGNEEAPVVCPVCEAIGAFEAAKIQ